MRILLTVLVVVLATVLVNAQSTAVYSEAISFEGTSKLALNMDNVEVKTIKGTRMIVECKVKVTHHKSDIILPFVGKNQSYSTIIDKSTDTLILSKNDINKPIVVDNKQAEIDKEYK